MLRARAPAHSICATRLQHACLGFTAASRHVLQGGQGNGTGALLDDGKDGEYPGADREGTEQQQEQRRKGDK